MIIDNEARKVAVLTLEQHTQSCDDDHDYCGSHDVVKTIMSKNINE